jgi:hypothetical protein
MKTFKTASDKSVEMRNTRYIDRFMGLNSAEEMTKYKLFPNGKEITESMAMIAAIEDHIHKYDPEVDFKNPNINLYVVGDGVRPRTAALFAFMTKWNCTSIDPEFKWLNENKEIRNLNCFKSKVEDIKFFDSENIAIIVAPHSHAPIYQTWDKIKADKKWLIRMKCCTKDELNIPSIGYTDKYVFSPKNRIEIYSNYIDLIK